MISCDAVNTPPKPFKTQKNLCHLCVTSQAAEVCRYRRGMEKMKGRDAWASLPLCVSISVWKSIGFVLFFYFVIGLYLGTRVFMMSQPMR